MPKSAQNLTKKLDKLKMSAKVATKLAVSERLLADQQHSAARELEILADGLDRQVVDIQVEIIEAAAAE